MSHCERQNTHGATGIVLVALVGKCLQHSGPFNVADFQ